MTAELGAHALVLLRIAYFGGLIGLFAFLALWESGKPLADPAPTAASSDPARDAAAATAKRRRHGLRNVGLFVVALLFVGGLVFSLESPAIALLSTFPGLLGRFGLPLVALVTIGLIVTDLAEYLYHRLCHRWRWLWLMHSVHHSDPALDVTTSLRFHPLEPALETVARMAVLLLLGVPLWVEVVRAVLLNPVNLFQHANVAYPSWVERRLQWLVVTPAMHRLHHSPVFAETNSNYGPGLSLWDRLFGTFLRPEHERPPSYGLTRLGEDSWQSVTGMLLTPIKARHLATL